MKDQNLREAEAHLDKAIFALEKITCTKDAELQKIIGALVQSQADISHEISLLEF